MALHASSSRGWHWPTSLQQKTELIISAKDFNILAPGDILALAKMVTFSRSQSPSQFYPSPILQARLEPSRELTLEAIHKM